MAAEIRSMFGDPIQPDEPNPSVIADLRDMLAKAERGEVRALAYTYLTPGGTLATSWTGDDNTAGDLMIGIAALHRRFVSYVIDDND